MDNEIYVLKQFGNNYTKIHIVYLLMCQFEADMTEPLPLIPTV